MSPTGEAPAVRRSYTADYVALARALDFRAPPAERIVSDPWAGPFLEAIGSPLARPGLLGGPVRLLAEVAARTPLSLGSMALRRHLALDRFLEGELRAPSSPPPQVVILGAGLDARAYRFGGVAPGTVFFEVDHPAFSPRKRDVVRRVVGETPHVRFVAADLERTPLASALIGAGFDIDRPSVFVWEGVTYYLSREAVEGTLRAARMLMAPGSSVGFDLWRAPRRGRLLSYGARAASRVLMRLLGEPFRFWLPPGGPSPSSWLAELGYSRVEVTGPASRAEASPATRLLHRLVPFPLTILVARP